MSFFVLHEIGAHCTYSEVPRLGQLSIRGVGPGGPPVGRDQYDRLAHFRYGLLMFPVMWVRGDPGTAYRGSQGDTWDAQKHMTLASLGAVCGLLLVRLTRYGMHDSRK